MKVKINSDHIIKQLEVVKLLYILKEIYIIGARGLRVINTGVTGGQAAVSPEGGIKTLKGLVNAAGDHKKQLKIEN